MIKFGIHSCKTWALAISSFKNEALMTFGIPEIYANEIDGLNAVLHLPEIETRMNQIIPQLTHITKFVFQFNEIRDELIQSVSNFPQVDFILPIAMECAILKEVNVWFTF